MAAVYFTPTKKMDPSDSVTIEFAAAGQGPPTGTSNAGRGTFGSVFRFFTSLLNNQDSGELPTTVPDPLSLPTTVEAVLDLNGFPLNPAVVQSDEDGDEDDEEDTNPFLELDVDESTSNDEALLLEFHRLLLSEQVENLADDPKHSPNFDVLFKKMQEVKPKWTQTDVLAPLLRSQMAPGYPYTETAVFKMPGCDLSQTKVITVGDMTHISKSSSNGPCKAYILGSQLKLVMKTVDNDFVLEQRFDQFREFAVHQIPCAFYCWNTKMGNKQQPITLNQSFCEFVASYPGWSTAYEFCKHGDVVYIRRTLRSMYLLHYLNKHKFDARLPAILSDHIGFKLFKLPFALWRSILETLSKIVPSNIADCSLRFTPFLPQPDGLKGVMDITYTLILHSRSIQFSTQ